MCDFFQFHIEIEGKMWVDYLGGEGAKGMLPPPPLKLLGGGAAPSSYAYVVVCICTSSNPFAPFFTDNKS